MGWVAPPHAFPEGDGFLTGITYVYIRENTYQDSMKLMRFQASLKGMEGIVECGVAMGTPANKAQFRRAGLSTEEMDRASASDICIVLRGTHDDAISRAIGEIERYFSAKGATQEDTGELSPPPRSLSSALTRLPDANLALISVPGDYAAYEAWKAIDRGLHVFLFSDNVSLDDEVDLKVAAERKGLLVMGPDCGTSILSGVGLGFSNAVRRGRVGIVGASGTGIQEISCLIHRMGEGVSQAIGTGGRDLLSKVGGRTFIQATDALMKDSQTEVLALIGKRCDHDVWEKILSGIDGARKPIVVYFVDGGGSTRPTGDNVHLAADFLHTAATCVSLTRGENPPHPPTAESLRTEMRETIDAEARRFSPGQRYLRAILAGGSFAGEACRVLRPILGELYAHPVSGEARPLEDPERSRGHCVVDLGADYFTQGRVHPMIDSTARNERLAAEGRDEEVRVLLVDIILGHGADADPAGGMADVVSRAKRKMADRGAYLSVVASLCGTEGDSQGLGEQRKKIERTGAIVVESASKAIILAGLIAAH
jgi:FdrA protein